MAEKIYYVPVSCSLARQVRGVSCGGCLEWLEDCRFRWWAPTSPDLPRRHATDAGIAAYRKTLSTSIKHLRPRRELNAPGLLLVLELKEGTTASCY